MIGERCVMLANARDRLAHRTRDADGDADTFFGVELPALGEWAFDATRAITAPALSIVGRDTLRLWVEVHELMRSTMPNFESLEIDGIGHLLHLQRPEPVARGIAAFLGRHPIR
jgi:pimeloyl-ACP methyl ester carboxylesterase